MSAVGKEITDEDAPALENQLVHNVYDNIADHFSRTRHTAWPKVSEFVKKVECGGTILDVGCGNGKYFNLNQSIFQVGFDMSQNLLTICREKDYEVLRSNALYMPFKNESFSAVICIATLHHLSTKARRLKVLNEIIRVMLKDGMALVYVWAKEQYYSNKKSSFIAKQSSAEKTKIKYEDAINLNQENYNFLPVYKREENFPRNDMLVPWISKTAESRTIHHRFYHVFTEGELEELLSECEQSVKILNSYYDQGNWVVKFTKL